MFESQLANEVGKIEQDEDQSASGHIMLNATAEFCRTLGDIPTYGLAGNRDEDVDELMVGWHTDEYVSL